jgi:hypothetical protein
MGVDDRRRDQPPLVQQMAAAQHPGRPRLSGCHRRDVGEQFDLAGPVRDAYDRGPQFVHSAGARGEREVELGALGLFPGHRADAQAPQELGGPVAEGVRGDREDQLDAQVGLQEFEDLTQPLGEGHGVHDDQDPLAVPYGQPVPLLDQC